MQRPRVEGEGGGTSFRVSLLLVTGAECKGSGFAGRKPSIDSQENEGWRGRDVLQSGGRECTGGDTPPAPPECGRIRDGDTPHLWSQL